MFYRKFDSLYIWSRHCTNLEAPSPSPFTEQVLNIVASKSDINFVITSNSFERINAAECSVFKLDLFCIPESVKGEEMLYNCKRKNSSVVSSSESQKYYKKKESEIELKIEKKKSKDVKH